MKTVAVGIPFLASKYTSALELCLNSVKRYLPEVNEVFLQVDNSNEELTKEFD